MKPNKQDFFNQYRENTIIEVVQELAKSSAGTRIAFKGGTALKLFYNLPRYSEDIDYDTLAGTLASDLFDTIAHLFRKKKWEITDEAVKYHTLLFELRFAGPERRFRIRIEISTREKKLRPAILLLRGVPVLTLEPSFLMTEKLLTLIERGAGRDVFDAWFILNNAYPLDESMVKESIGSWVGLYKTILAKIETADPNKIFRDTGKLLNEDHRSWIRTSFLDDFKRLVRSKIGQLEQSGKG
jgi:hypothetical protein